MGKRNNPTSRKVDKLSCEFHQFKSETEERLEKLQRNQIIQYLTQTSGPKNKFTYTYEEIAMLTGCSSSYVHKVASEAGLARRSLKSS